jgi:hypothetical protein
MALCARFGFAMFSLAMPRLACAFTFELDDANVCFGEITEAADLVQPLLESIT